MARYDDFSGPHRLSDESVPWAETATVSAFLARAPEAEGLPPLEQKFMRRLWHAVSVYEATAQKAYGEDFARKSVQFVKGELDKGLGVWEFEGIEFGEILNAPVVGVYIFRPQGSQKEHVGFRIQTTMLDTGIVSYEQLMEAYNALTRDTEPNVAENMGRQGQILLEAVKVIVENLGIDFASDNLPTLAATIDGLLRLDPQVMTNPIWMAELAWYLLGYME